MDGRNDAGRISGMNARKLDMLHNGRNKSMGTVTDGVGFTFHGMVQETVNEDGAVGGYAYRGFHIACHAFLIIYNFHTSAA